MFDIDKCEVGKKVRITTKFDYDDPMGVNSSMEAFKGKIATVTFKGRNINGEFVKLDIDRGRFKWTASMLDPMALNKGKHSHQTIEEITPTISKTTSSGMIDWYHSAYRMEYTSSWTPDQLFIRSE